MFRILKVLQISLLAGSLVNLNMLALAQDTAPQFADSGIAGVPKAAPVPSNEVILTATFKDLNTKREAAGKPAVDQNNVDNYVSTLSPRERHAFYTDLDQSNVRARKELGLKAAELMRFEPIGVSAISETHENFVDKLIRSKSGLDKPNSQNSTTSSNSGTAPTKLSGVDDSDLTSSITMIAVGFVSSRLYKYKMTTDIMVAAAGGAAFLVGEIMSTGKFKEVQKDLEIQQQNANPDQVQVESLKTLKKSYQEAKEAAETKKKFQMAATAAFLVAATMAFFMKGLEITAEATTASALVASAGNAGMAATAATASCPYTAATCILITPCTTAASTFSADVARRKAMNLFRDTNMAPSLAAQASDAPIRLEFFTEISTLGTTCPAAAAAPPAVAAEDSLIVINNSAGIPSVAAMADLDSLYFQKIKTFRFYQMAPPAPKISSTYFDKLISLAFPKAEASMMNLLMGGAGAGAGILLGIVTTMGVTVDTYLFAPKNRGMVWGLLGGLSLVSSNASSKVIEKLDDNISKIDQTINSLNSSQATTIDSAKIKNSVSAEKNPIANSQKLGAINEDIISVDPSQRTSCLASSGEKECPSFASQLANNPSFNMLPPDLQMISKGMVAMGDGLSGVSRLSGNTSALVSSNGGRLNAIGKMLGNTKSNLNLLLAKNGRSPLNFEKEQGGLSKSLNDSVQKALNKNNMSARSFLSSIGAGNGRPDSSDKAGNSNANSDEKKSGSPNLRLGNVYNLSAPANKNDLPIISDEEKNNSIEVAKEEKTDQKLEGYELINNDITTDKEASLFELISNRYRKSGYQRLFKIIKE